MDAEKPQFIKDPDTEGGYIAADAQPAPASHNLSAPQRQKDEDEIDLIQLWSVIWNKKKLIGIIFGSAVVISVIVSLLMTKVYKSSAVIIPISSSRSSSSNLLASVSSLLPFSVGRASGSSKIMALLYSRTLRVMVIKKLNLIPLLIKKKDGNHKLLKAQAILKTMTQISKNKQLGTITVSVFYKNPVLAQKIASVYVSQLRHILNKKRLRFQK